MDLYKELLDFLEDLKKYREEVLTKTDSKSLSEYTLEYEELRKRMDKSWALSIEKYPLLEEYSSKIRREESREALREKLVSKHGALKDEIAKLIGRTDINQFSRTWNRALSPVFGTGANKDALSLCIDYTLEAIGKLKSDIERGIRDSQGNVIEKAQRLSTEPPKAFIAHEGMTKSLQKVKDFLDALGVNHLIAEIEPSDGRVVERQVQWTQGQADFAIVLATRGKVIDKESGKPYMGMNVADELGRAREVFKNRIILLLQKGVEPHTNISGIVYEPFTPQNMENAFTKIIKELRNWGLLHQEK